MADMVLLTMFLYAAWQRATGIFFIVWRRSQLL
jgi:hypothetical protein